MHDLFSFIQPVLNFFGGYCPTPQHRPSPPPPIPHQKSNGPSLRCYQVLQLFSGPELIILDSSHETTRYYYSSPDMMTVHPMVTPPPPSSLLPFHQVPLTNFWYPFILLGGEGYCESKLFCTKTKHMTWPGYKCRSLDPDSTSLIIRPPCLHKRRVQICKFFIQFPPVEPTSILVQLAVSLTGHL